MVLDFINDIYPILYIPIGLVAVWLGVDRAIKSEEEESDTLKIIGGIAGILLMALTILLSINEYNDPADIITNYSILFGLLTGMSLIARPFKELPLAFVMAVLVALGLSYVALIANQGDITFFGIIPFEVILIGGMIIVILVFLISFIQEQFIDGLMFILGWGPIIFILGLSLAAQGLTLLLDFPNSDGILWYLPG